MPSSRPRVWTQRPPRVQAPAGAERQAFIAACEVVLADVLRPRLLPVVTPTAWNYPVGLHGAYAGGRYRFITRYRSGRPDNLGEEFDRPFARVDRMGPGDFTVQWMRHTGAWWPLRIGLSLEDALHVVATDGILHASFA